MASSSLSSKATDCSIRQRNYRPSWRGANRRKAESFDRDCSARGWPSPHYHANEDEAFFVQEGKMSFLCEGLARLGSRRWKIGGTPVMCSLERCRQGLKNSSSGARRNSPEREVRIPNVSKPSDLKTASTSWRPCRSVLAGQLVCSAKLSDQIL